MCLIALAYRAHPRYPFIVAANRDEFFDRATAPARFWPEAPHILAGKDLRAGGTWMGVTRFGRFAAITNHRDMRRAPVVGPSRGLLALAALDADPPRDGVDREGYNLIYGTFDALRYRCNITNVDVALAPGLHGLSNAVLDTPWPKVTKAVEGLRQALHADEPDSEHLFSLLADETVADADLLPDTGLGYARERALSSIRIDLPAYGTRCSTVVTVDVEGQVYFEERDLRTGHVVCERFGV
ncbi:MAG: NRDE family protein [Flavobacteriales bacterium]|nr:NRDE family protein [Flavobacteriales bacterium]